MRVKIYQIDSEKDEHAYRFAPLSYVENEEALTLIFISKSIMVILM